MQNAAGGPQMAAELAGLDPQQRAAQI